MSFLAFTGLTVFLASLPLGLFVYYRKSKSLLSRAYLNLNLSVTIYGISYFLWQISTNTASQIFWFKVLGLGIILIEPAFLHFVFSLTDKMRKKKTFLIACYGINLLFIYFNFSGLLYLGFVPKHNLGLWPVPSFLFNIYLAWWFFQVFYGFVYFLIGLKENTGLKHNQIKYCTIAGVIGFTGAVTNWPMWYNINFPPYLNILIALHVSVIAYAILRYRLMDIEVIIKKTLVFAGMFIFAFGIFVTSTILVSQLIGGNRIISLAISAFIITLLLRPIESWLVSATNKYLFQKKYDSRKILKDFADEALTILNLDKLCKVTIDALAKNLYLANCAVLLLTRDEIGYEIYDSLGLEDKSLYFTKESDIVNRLKNDQSPLLYQSYDAVFQASDAEKKDMERVNSQLCIPLVIHKEMVGILSLGSKKSDQPYTNEDIDILTMLNKALAIAISNARLFMQAAQYEKLAAIGTLASSINHEVCNPLNNMSTHMQIFLSNLDKGFYKNKSQEELLQEVKSILQDSITQIQKVAGITSKLSSFAKPSKTVVSKPVSIAKGVEDALGVLSHRLQLDRINIVKNIPLNLPDVLADEDQLQEIFFNLIRNASEAIKENGTITINTREDADKIAVEVADTGYGIPEDDLDKIFDAFYTTKASGSGYGLSVVREIVWRNKGNISVKSKAGEGTTFYLDFPKA